MSKENVRRACRSVEESVTVPGEANYGLLPELYHSDMEFRESAEWPEAGVYKGLRSYERYWRQFTEHFSDFETKVERAFDGGDRVLTYLRMVGRDTQTGAPVELRAAVIFTFRGDKISLVESYLDHAKAYEAWDRGPNPRSGE